MRDNTNTSVRVKYEGEIVKETTQNIQMIQGRWHVIKVENPSMKETTTRKSPKQSTINKENTNELQALPLDTLEWNRVILEPTLLTTKW